MPTTPTVMCQESLAAAMRNMVFILMSHLACGRECNKICSCQDEQGQVRALAGTSPFCSKLSSLQNRRPGFLVALSFTVGVSAGCDPEKHTSFFETQFPHL